MNQRVTADLPPPAWYWLLPVLAVALRGLPYLRSLTLTPGEGEFIAPVGYMPDDFFSYAAFIREAAEHGRWLLLDPYTTDPQQPRFILLFHWLLGGATRLTGGDPMLVLELSRVPLIFLLFLAVWQFTGVVNAERKVRLWAAVLIGFSGGVEGFLQPCTGLAPQFVATRFREATWHLYGWNTFQSLSNPLWIAGLALTLWILMFAMDPRRSWNACRGGLLSCGIVIQFLIHPYSALVTLAVLLAWPVTAWALQAEMDWKRVARVCAWTAPAIAVLAAISHWQTSDPVYRLASNNVLGTLQLGVFWYPLTLGLVGLMALRGLKQWFDQKHPFLPQMIAWIGVVVLLHTSPVINGYHFVFHLHLPVAMLAAPAVAAVWSARGSSKSTWDWRRAGLACVLFASCILTTAESIGDIARRNRRPSAYHDLLHALKELPRGAVLAPPDLGNLVPAFTHHQVWIGHWFLTPAYRERAALYAAATEPDADDGELLELIRQARSDYVVAPAANCERLREVLGLPEGPVFDQWELLCLSRPTASKP